MLKIYVYRYIYQLRCRHNPKHHRRIEYAKAHYRAGDVLSIRCYKCRSEERHDVLSVRRISLEEGVAQRRINRQIAQRRRLRERLKKQQEAIARSKSTLTTPWDN